MFQIIQGSGKPLLDYKTATDLKLLHIGLTDNIETSLAKHTILKSFQDIFEGLGKLKKFSIVTLY